MIETVMTFDTRRFNFSLAEYLIAEYEMLIDMEELGCIFEPMMEGYYGA